MSLQGHLEYPNIFTSAHAQRFPKTSQILADCANALTGGIFADCFFLVLLDIVIQRRKARRESKSNVLQLSSEDVRKHLSRVSQQPEVALVQGLKTEHGEQLWGCMPKDDTDVQNFGRTICINAELALALEASTPGEYTERACMFMICITYVHETMHALHHHFLPPSHDSLPKEVSTTNEWGWALEAKLFGGTIGVVWPVEAAERGDFGAIDHLTLERRDLEKLPEKFLLAEDTIHQFLSELQSGNLRLPDLAELATVPAGDLPDGMVSTRQRPPPRNPWPIGREPLVLKPGEVISYVGNDRFQAPF
ncbi:hypothetical protein FB451DRAFT_484955 [Mycena latifolia]|nr:hypothetical protein FB451DRAFT_484955 [Mycena latifolia]